MKFEHQRWLASVQSLSEAKQLNDYLPDLLDMKNPADGALGALPVATVKQIVNWLAGRCQSSATIGDLPMQAARIQTALLEMQQSGVDYLKVGLFNEPALADCLQDLKTFLQQFNTPVIAVLFADQQYDKSVLTDVLDSGFSGVMLDTANKNGQHLLNHQTSEQLQIFVNSVKSWQRLCGLAGALRAEDIAILKPLGADYLGFRSALCPQRERQQNLAISAVQQLVDKLAAPVPQAPAQLCEETL
ncbi:MAG: (5-formylfuran-3-yl)methyl phosphate synthase [Methylophaga sp.]